MTIIATPPPAGPGRLGVTLVALAVIAGAPVRLLAQEPDPTRGDGRAAERQLPGIDVPLVAAPLEEVELASADGVDLRFFVRRPRGDGPFPTILFLHGGGKHAGPERLRRGLLGGAVQTRFLAKGFAVVECTRRPFWTEKPDGGDEAVGFDDAVDDTVRIVAKVRALPGVDGRRLVLYGGSGGGVLALVTASRTDVAGVIAGEPATVVPLEPEAGAGGAEGRGYRRLMADPQAAYVGERREAMRAWMAAVRCPVLVLQGRAEGLYRINTELLVPELRSLGKEVAVANYPDVKHGFYFGSAGSGATPELVDRVVKESIDFISGLPATADGKAR
jgi:dipeptidyl aminopeptidase/acylaminoacyl peptidase